MTEQELPLDIVVRCRRTFGEAGSIKALLEDRADAAAEIERLHREIAQMKAQAGDNIELQEAEQRGFERGRRYLTSTPGRG